MQKNIETETNETWNEMAKLLKQFCLKQTVFFEEIRYIITQKKNKEMNKRTAARTKRKRKDPTNRNSRTMEEKRKTRKKSGGKKKQQNRGGKKQGVRNKEGFNNKK